MVIGNNHVHVCAHTCTWISNMHVVNHAHFMPVVVKLEGVSLLIKILAQIVCFWCGLLHTLIAFVQLH